MVTNASHARAKEGSIQRLNRHAGPALSTTMFRLTPHLTLAAGPGGLRPDRAITSESSRRDPFRGRPRQDGPWNLHAQMIGISNRYRICSRRFMSHSAHNLARPVGWNLALGTLSVRITAVWRPAGFTSTTVASTGAVVGLRSIPAGATRTVFPALSCFT